jgi:large subunit ribosomal protein L25
MEEIAVVLEARSVTGKAVKHLRKQGLLPAVIHDHGKESVVVMGPYLALYNAYKKAGKHHPVTITAVGKQYLALIRTAEFDPKKHQLRHIVFNAVKADEKVTTDIPVRVKLDEGNDATPAERAGLVVLEQLEVVEVEALPKDLPEFLSFDGEKLIEIGDQATVADLIVPSTVTVKTDPAHPLATVFEPSALQAANDAAGGTAEETESVEEVATEGAEGETAADSETSDTTDETPAAE